MDRYSLMIMTDSTSPVRRYEVEKRLVRRGLWGAGIAAFLLLVGLVDYVRVRVDNAELDSLRVETAEQRDRIARFSETLSGVESNLQRLQDLERKVRIIANLPGSAATGGEDVAEVGDLDGEGGDLGSDVEPDAVGEGLEAPGAGPSAGGEAPAGESPQASLRAGSADRVGALRRDAERLGLVAHARELSLLELVEKLEGKRHRLASSPAIWPTEGWLTSRFGARISPFTGRRQFHAGIDVAGAIGTPIVAPARGKVTFAGKRGPLGNSLIIDHGYGVRTLYGHTDELLVKRGQEIERGDRIATLGNTGRSTGPHLHYVVEVNGKAQNPLDYIFD